MEKIFNEIILLGELSFTICGTYIYDEFGDVEILGYDLVELNILTEDISELKIDGRLVLDAFPCGWKTIEDDLVVIITANEIEAETNANNNDENNEFNNNLDDYFE